jgi:hypothetical protein
MQIYGGIDMADTKEQLGEMGLKDLNDSIDILGCIMVKYGKNTDQAFVLAFKQSMRELQRQTSYGGN